MINVIILFTVFVSSALILFLLNELIRLKLKNKLSENENLTSVPIFKGVLFISWGILQSEIIPTFQTITKILPNQFNGNDLLLREISFYCIFLAIIFIVFIVLFLLSYLLFSLFQRGENIFIEVANNNLQSLFTFCAIFLALTFAIKIGVSPILDQFIPYPTMPIYR